MARIYKCNMCGKELGKNTLRGFLSMNGIVGYGSKYDGDIIEMDVCSECADKLIEQCVISPIEDDEDDFD